MINKDATGNLCVNFMCQILFTVDTDLEEKPDEKAGRRHSGQYDHAACLSIIIQAITVGPTVLLGGGGKAAGQNQEGGRHQSSLL
jgi:hypothetical protein